MTDFRVLEPAADPNNRVSFLIDWEMTMKCNLDCSYCPSDLYGGHDNTTQHPEKSRCFTAADFMMEYVDLYMQHKPKGIKYVFLNLYGGESLHHPDVVEVLEYTKKAYDKYRDRWPLTITTTTNGIVSEKKLRKILPFIDEFTFSFHGENTEKQHTQFKDNLLLVKNAGRRLKCIIMMHNDPDIFKISQGMIQWCRENDINFLAKQLDNGADAFGYDRQQIQWFDKVYSDKSYNVKKNLNASELDADSVSLVRLGRPCCGGRQMCQDTNYHDRHYFVANEFPDWYCSVNEFFVYIKQVTEEIFVNKDCKMDFNSSVAPIGMLETSQDLINWTKHNLIHDTMPIIRCKKNRCRCGLCAPKARELGDFYNIMKKYRKK